MYKKKSNNDGICANSNLNTVSLHSNLLDNNQESNSGFLIKNQLPKSYQELPFYCPVFNSPVEINKSFTILNQKVYYGNLRCLFEIWKNIAVQKNETKVPETLPMMILSIMSWNSSSEDKMGLAGIVMITELVENSISKNTIFGSNVTAESCANFSNYKNDNLKSAYGMALYLKGVCKSIEFKKYTLQFSYLYYLLIDCNRKEHMKNTKNVNVVYHEIYLLLNEIRTKKEIQIDKYKNLISSFINDIN